MKNYLLVAYTTFFLFSTKHLVFFTVSGASFDATPRPALVGQRCTLTCRDDNAASIVIKIYKTMWDTTPLQIIPGFNNNNARWRSRQELQITMNAATHTLEVSFTVRPMDRNRPIICASISPNSEQFMELEVERKPAVVDLTVANFTEDGTAYELVTEVVAGKVFTVQCEIQTGIPHSEDYSISVPGERVGDLRDYYGFADDSKGYQQGTIEQEFRPAIEDNGKPITCALSNRHGTANRTIILNVKSPGNS